MDSGVMIIAGVFIVIVGILTAKEQRQALKQYKAVSSAYTEAFAKLVELQQETNRLLNLIAGKLERHQ